MQNAANQMAALLERVAGLLDDDDLVHERERAVREARDLRLLAALEAA